MTARAYTTPDRLTDAGVTVAVVRDEDDTVLDSVHLPYRQDRAAWDQAADQALTAAGWGRVGAWEYDGAELVADIARLVRARLRRGGPVTSVVDVAAAVRAEYGSRARLSGGELVGRGIVRYEVVSPTREPNTWNRLGSAFIYE